MREYPIWGKSMGFSAISMGENPAEYNIYEILCEKHGLIHLILKKFGHTTLCTAVFHFEIPHNGSRDLHILKQWVQNKNNGSHGGFFFSIFNDSMGCT